MKTRGKGRRGKKGEVGEERVREVDREEEDRERTIKIGGEELKEREGEGERQPDRQASREREMRTNKKSNSAKESPFQDAINAASISHLRAVLKSGFAFNSSQSSSVPTGRRSLECHDSLPRLSVTTKCHAHRHSLVERDMQTPLERQMKLNDKASTLLDFFFFLCVVIFSFLFYPGCREW